AIAMLAGLLILFGQINVPILQYGVAVAVVRTSWFWTLAAIVLAILGFLTQWRTMHTYNLAWSEAQQASANTFRGQLVKLVGAGGVRMGGRGACVARAGGAEDSGELDDGDLSVPSPPNPT